MNVDDFTTQLRERREQLLASIETDRGQRNTLSRRIKANVDELARIDRLIRAAEGRKRKDGPQ